MNTNYLQALNIITTVKMAIDEGKTSLQDLYDYEYLLTQKVFRHISLSSEDEKEAQIAIDYNVLFTQVKIQIIKTK